MQELKRCPFCNYNKIHVINIAPRRKAIFVAECKLCKAQGPVSDTRAGAAVLWNLANRHQFENGIDTSEISITINNKKVDLLSSHITEVIKKYILESIAKEIE